MARIPSQVQSPIRPAVPKPLELKKPVLEDPSKTVKTFGQTLKEYVGDVNRLQEESGATVERFLTGEVEDVHDVMIAVEKAGISFEMMMEIRNKMVEAYHELMRMQV